MEYDDIEFVEGVHKSVRRAPLHKIETDDEQAAEPSKEPRVENELAPLPANTPEPQRARSGYRRWFQIVAVLLLICIVGGGVLIYLKLHTAPQTQAAHTAPKHGAFCTTTGAVVNMNEGAPSLNSISARAQNDIWAVGNLANQTLTEHWDGTRWLSVSSPNGQGGTSGANTQMLQMGSKLNSVTTISNDDAWAVGAVNFSLVYNASPGVGMQTLIEHWDGHQWSIVPSVDGTAFRIVSSSATGGTLLQGRNALYGVSAVSANDVWAVGSTDSSKYYIYSAYEQPNISPLIEHWDGNAWKIVPTPNLPVHAVLSAVTAIAANNVWAVGSIVQSQNSSALIAHWDGQQWSVVPNASTVHGGDLGSISASSANDIWAAGFGLIEHWDGTSWSQVSYPMSTTKGAYTVLQSVVALSANNVWLAGFQANPSSNGNSSVSDNLPTLEHWDGQQWKSVVPGQAVNGNLNAIASANGHIWAVGTSVVGLQEIQNPLIETNC